MRCTQSPLERALHATGCARMSRAGVALLHSRRAFEHGQVDAARQHVDHGQHGRADVGEGVLSDKGM